MVGNTFKFTSEMGLAACMDGSCTKPMEDDSVVCEFDFIFVLKMKEPSENIIMCESQTNLIWELIADLFW